MKATPSEDVRFFIAVNYRETEVTARRNGEVIWRSIIESGGVDWILAVSDYLRFERNLIAPRLIVEEVVREIGAAVPLTPLRTMVVKGFDSHSHRRTEMEVTSDDVFEDLNMSLENITYHLRRIFAGPEKNKKGVLFNPPSIPTELKPAIVSYPVTLTSDFGGLRDLDNRLEHVVRQKVVSEIANQ